MILDFCGGGVVLTLVCLLRWVLFLVLQTGGLVWVFFPLVVGLDRSAGAQVKKLRKKDGCLTIARPGSLFYVAAWVGGNFQTPQKMEKQHIIRSSPSGF